MGNKGSNPPEIPMTMPQTPDYSAMMAPMMQMMQTSNAAMSKMMDQSMQSMQFALNPPEITDVEEGDWVAKNEELQKKIRLDAAALASKRRGRAYTDITKSALEDEEPNLVKSVLEGNNGS